MNFSTGINKWMFLEENVLFAQLNYSVLYLGYHYIRGTKQSIWRDSHSFFGENNDFWNSKQISDILHYVKFEFIQQLLFATLFQMSLFAINDKWDLSLYRK